MFDDQKTNTTALTSVLRQEITAAGGSLGFDRYMAICLYHPELGYYNHPRFKLGKNGDFTTAAEISPIYAECMVNAALPIINSLPHPAVLEIGAGSGQFALNFLLALNRTDIRYTIHEISPRCRQLQYEKIKTHAPALLSQVTWLDQLPKSFEGVMIANEVLDALPVHCFAVRENMLFEKRVIFNEAGFQFDYQNPEPPLADALMQLQSECALPEHYDSEINLTLEPFVTTLSNLLTRGLILFADYGYGRSLYYHPERTRGTLMCFHQHQYHDNPLILPGLQDITAHVDFTRVAETAMAAGCTLSGYTTQAAFLLESGLQTSIEAKEKKLDQIEQFKLHQAIKTLTLPTEMGEVIKIMALTKALDYSLPGMKMADRRREL